jgi:hypothetical protein
MQNTVSAGAAGSKVKPDVIAPTVRPASTYRAVA